MPNSLGKKTKVAVLTEADNLDSAKEADKILTKEDLEMIKEGKLSFTKIICTVESLNLLKPLARYQWGWGMGFHFGVSFMDIFLRVL